MREEGRGELKSPINHQVVGFMEDVKARRGLGGEGVGVRVGAGCSGGGGGVDPFASTLVASTRCWKVFWKLFMIKQRKSTMT